MRLFSTLILTLLVVALALPDSASAAVAYVDQTANSQTSGEGATFEHDIPAGDDQYLVVMVEYWSTETADTVRYGATDLALIKSDGQADSRKVDIWGLAVGDNAAPDTANIYVSSSSGNWGGSYIVAMNYTGVLQASSTGATISAKTTTVDSLRVQITTQSANSLLIGGAAGVGPNQSPFTPGASQTERFDGDTGGSWPTSYWGADRAVTTAQEYNFGVTSSAADGMTLCVIELKEVSVNPVLDLPTTTLNFAYNDSSAQKFGIGNSGSGILSWETTNICDWISAGVADTGTVGAGYDSVTVQLKWAEIASGSSLSDTVAVTGGGDGQVVINATGHQYTVEANHPRLFFNENTVAALRAKCKSAESTAYGTFKTYVDANDLADSYPLADAEQHGLQLMRLAFCFVAENGDTTYLQEADECADVMFDSFASWYTDANAQKGLSMFYDWCYSGFGATRKAHFGDSVAIALSREMAGNNFMTNPAHSQIVVVEDPMYMALAIHGDGLDDSGAIAALDSCYNHMFGGYHINANLDSIARDGGGYEGDYTVTLMERHSKMFWFWDYGTDVSPWALSSNMTGYGDHLLYDTFARTSVSPDGDAFGEGKQCDSNLHGGARAGRILLVNRMANALSDSSLIWLDGQYDAQSCNYVSSTDHWHHIIVKDTLAGTAAPTTGRGYTSAKQFDIGTVFMREGWDLAATSTDVWAVYRHEQYPYGHAHADAGHFIIGRGNDLMLIDSGEYGGRDIDHDTNYFQQTIAHNAVTIKLFGEGFNGKENTGGQNPGAQRGWTGFPLTLGAYADSLACCGRGKITDYEHKPDTLTYIRSDLTDAYSASKVDTVRREFVWLEAKDAFVVFDYAAVCSTGYLQKSLLHTISAPANTADVWTVVEDTTSMRIHFYWNASSDTIGGTGNEFDANGTNYPVPGTTHSDNGAWRIEALTARDNLQRWMVTVIEVVEKGTAFATVESLASGDYYGAVVDGDTLLFHKYGGAYTCSATGGDGGNGEESPATAGRRPIALDAAGRNRGRRGRR